VHMPLVPEVLPKSSKSSDLVKKVRDAGVAGAISYASWEVAFWALSIPVCLWTYVQVEGHMPDLASAEDLGKLTAEAFAFINLARLVVPVRLGLAISTVPWVQKNVVDKVFPSQKAD